VSSFHNLLQDSVAGKMSLRVAAQRVSDTLEAQMGKFGPGGVEIYRFAWERFNRRVVFHIVFYSSLGTVLGVLGGARGVARLDESRALRVAAFGVRRVSRCSRWRCFPRAFPTRRRTF
jgi:hypothetical protein